MKKTQAMKFTGGDEGMTTSQIIANCSHLLANERFDRSIYIWGPTGIGKSAIQRQIVKNLADKYPCKNTGLQEKAVSGALEMLGTWGLVDIRVSTLDPTDMRGLPFPHLGLTAWLPPEDMPFVGQEHRFPERGVLFLDELNLGGPAIQAACYSLILDRRIGMHRLMPGWKIVAAGNLNTERAYTFELAHPLKNRFSHYKLKADLDSFKVWAYKAGVDARVIAFLNWNRDYLHMDVTESAYGFPTPRSWESVSNFLSASASEFIVDNVNATVGEGAGAMFKGFLDIYEQQENAANMDIAKLITNKLTPKPLDMAELGTAWALGARVAAFVREKRDSMPDACRFMTSPFWKNMREIARTMITDLKLVDPTAFQQALAKHPDILESFKQEARIFNGAER